MQEILRQEEMLQSTGGCLFFRETFFFSFLVFILIQLIMKAIQLLWIIPFTYSQLAVNVNHIYKYPDSSTLVSGVKGRVTEDYGLAKLKHKTNYNGSKKGKNVIKNRWDKQKTKWHNEISPSNYQIPCKKSKHTN